MFIPIFPLSFILLSIRESECPLTLWDTISDFTQILPICILIIIL